MPKSIFTIYFFVHGRLGGIRAERSRKSSGCKTAQRVFALRVLCGLETDRNKCHCGHVFRKKSFKIINCSGNNLDFVFLLPEKLHSCRTGKSCNILIFFSI